MVTTFSLPSLEAGLAEHPVKIPVVIAANAKALGIHVFLITINPPYKGCDCAFAIIEMVMQNSYIP